MKNGKTGYEIKLEQGSDKLEVSFSADGKILDEETTVAMNKVPEAVKKGLAASKYGKWKANKAEKVVSGEDAQNVRYEFALSHGRHRAEAVFDSSGKMVKEEVAAVAKKGGKKDEDEKD